MPYKKCKICNKEFYVKPSHLKMGYGTYCSRKCKHTDQKTGKYIECTICGKKIWKQQRDLKRSKSGNFFCNKTCQTKWRNQYFSEEKHANWQGGEFINYRQIIKKIKRKPICELCGNNDYRVLIVHHIDCNRKNNDIKNLAWLCCNCHCLVHRHNVKFK